MIQTIFQSYSYIFKGRKFVMKKISPGAILFLIMVSICNSQQLICNKVKYIESSLYSPWVNNKLGGHVQSHVGWNCAQTCFQNWEQVQFLFEKLPDNCLCQNNMRSRCQVLLEFDGYKDGKKRKFKKACYVFDKGDSGQLMALTAFPAQDNYNCFKKNDVLTQNDL